MLLHTGLPPYYLHLAAFRGRHYLDDGLSDQGSSSVVSSRRQDSAVPVKQLPKGDRERQAVVHVLLLKLALQEPSPALL